MSIRLFVFILFHFGSSTYFSTENENVRSDFDIRILIIGDSVDRYAVKDWCHENSGIICTPDRNHSEISCKAILSLEGNVARNFSAFQRLKSWDMTFCFSKKRSIIMLSMLNALGVTPQLHCKESNNVGMEGFEITKRYNYDTFLNQSIFAILPTVESALNGKFNGIMIHSSFHDVQRLVQCSGFDMISKHEEDRVDWVQNWLSDALHFVHVVKRRYYGPSQWVGWRTANKIATKVGWKNYWFNEIGENLLFHMGNVANKISELNGIDLIDYGSFPNISVNMRDHVHPSASAGVMLGEVIVHKTKTALRYLL